MHVQTLVETTFGEAAWAYMAWDRWQAFIHDAWDLGLVSLELVGEPPTAGHVAYWEVEDLVGFRALYAARALVAHFHPEVQKEPS